MFRHRGSRRTYGHNIRLASVLSFVAGVVNVCGILSIRVFTTNVTGHFALFAEELSREAFNTAFVLMLFILSFLLGAFASSLVVEFASKKRIQASYAIPLLFEFSILVCIMVFSERYNWLNKYAQSISCAMLFAMGIQNALVTKISRATVRTTHLTGLFTDLGIELSQLFFYKKREEQRKLSKSIRLRLTIIGSFFIGGVLGGFLYRSYGIYTLSLAVIGLIFALFYDILRIKLYMLGRKLNVRPPIKRIRNRY